MKQHYLISTDHLPKGLWFKNEEDYKTGMNLLAVLAARSPIKILAFILMSNHVHLVVYGERDEADDFISRFKNQYSRYMNRKYGSYDNLRRKGVDIKSVPRTNEALEKAIAYVQMNSVAANICATPSQYLWGTGNSFFTIAKTSGSPVGNIPKRKRILLLHSRNYDVPADWLVCESGYILPESYIDIQAVEALYRSPRRMNYFLQNSSKARKVLDIKEQRTPVFIDSFVQSSLPVICWSYFQKQQVSELSEDEQVELLRQLRYRFNANPHQLSRVTGLTEGRVADLLDRV